MVTAALSAPIKPNFLVKIFQKVPKNAFWLVFSKFSPEAKKILPKQGLLCFGRARKINLVELTKKTLDPLRKIVDPLLIVPLNLAKN